MELLNVYSLFPLLIISTTVVFLIQAFSKIFKSAPDDLDMHVIYDVSHNVAKVEEHVSFHFPIIDLSLTNIHESVCT